MQINRFKVLCPFLYKKLESFEQFEYIIKIKNQLTFCFYLLSGFIFWLPSFPSAWHILICIY